MHALHEVALGVSRGWKIQAFEFSVTATMSVIFPISIFLGLPAAPSLSQGEEGC